MLHVQAQNGCKQGNMSAVQGMTEQEKNKKQETRLALDKVDRLARVVEPEEQLHSRLALAHVPACRRGARHCTALRRVALRVLRIQQTRALEHTTAPDF